MFKVPIHIAALICVCTGYLLAPMGMAAVNVAIPNMAIDLQASAIKISWLPTVYILASVACMLPVGKIADNYGRKRIFTYGLFLNLIAAVASSMATSIDWILFWRCIQGCAGAMIFGTGMAIISLVVPQKKRGAAFGIVASCIYLGLTIAPAIGGFLTEWFSWRAVFYFQIPLFIGLILFVLVFLPQEWKNDTKTRFDWIGSFLFFLFSLLLVLGFQELPSALGLILLAGAVTSCMLFTLHQSKISEPLIRVQMFKESKMFTLSLSTSFLMYASNFAIMFLLSLYLQYIKGLSAFDTGQVLLIQAFMMTVIAPFAGRLSDKFEPRLVSTTGCLIVLAGFICLSLLSEDTSKQFIGVSLGLIGFGFGLFSTPNNNAIMSSVKKSEVGTASATMNLSRTIGNLFGMSVVNLFIHLFIGNQPITDQQLSALMQTVNYSLTMSLILVSLACLLSILRGKER